MIPCSVLPWLCALGHETLVEGQRRSFSIAVTPGEAIAVLSNFKCRHDGAQRQYVQHWNIQQQSSTRVGKVTRYTENTWQKKVLHLTSNSFRHANERARQS